MFKEPTLPEDFEDQFFAQIGVTTHTELSRHSHRRRLSTVAIVESATPHLPQQQNQQQAATMRRAALALLLTAALANKQGKRGSPRRPLAQKSKDACPSSCGECEEAETCIDSTSWYYKKSKETCSDYVSKKSKNCKKKDEFKVKAEEACPMTCGAC